MSRPTIGSSLSEKRASRSANRPKYLVTVLGRPTSSYDEQRLRVLKARPDVVLWLESNAGGGLTVARRTRKTLTARDPLRGQGMRTIESLFREPVQGLAQLIPGGGGPSKQRAFDRLRDAVDSRDADGEWELLKRRSRQGIDVVSLEAPKGRLCVLVEREPHIGLPYLRSTSAKAPRLEARNASYDPILNLVTVELRGVCPSAAMIDSLDVTLAVDEATLRLYDSSNGERFGPGLGYAEKIRVEPNSVGDWRWFCFDSPRLKDPPRGSDARPGIVSLQNLDGPPLRVAIGIPDYVRDPLSPLYGLVPGIAPGDPPRRITGEVPSERPTADRQLTDKSDSVEK